jgi:hypothetical protein
MDGVKDARRDRAIAAQAKAWADWIDGWALQQMREGDLMNELFVPANHLRLIPLVVMEMVARMWTDHVGRPDLRYREFQRVRDQWITVRAEWLIP